MRRKLEFVIVFSALLLTMCRSYAMEPATYRNGLSCRNYTDYELFEWRGEEGASCSYVCPDGSVREANIADTISPLYGASKEELDAQLCGVALQATPTETLASPTPVPSVTLAASPTVAASLTAELPVTGPDLLTGKVLMCDLGANLINLRMVQPPPDLTDKTVTARIAERDSMCYANPTNPSVLTCTLPAEVTFPARIIVSVDGAVVGDLTYMGIGCEILTTAVPTTTP